jgi:hypothetical protein
MDIPKTLRTKANSLVFRDICHFSIISETRMNYSDICGSVEYIYSTYGLKAFVSGLTAALKL